MMDIRYKHTFQKSDNAIALRAEVFFTLIFCSSPIAIGIDLTKRKGKPHQTPISNITQQKHCDQSTSINTTHLTRPFEQEKKPAYSRIPPLTMAHLHLSRTGISLHLCITKTVREKKRTIGFGKNINH
jgi:hypothetical protein